MLVDSSDPSCRLIQKLSTADMSGSETGGVMAGSRGEPFASPTGAKSMRLSFSDGSSLYKPVALTGTASSPPYQPPSTLSKDDNIEGSAGGAPLLPHELNMNVSGGESVKKKRGRPRKYEPDGTMSLSLTPGSITAQSAGFSSQATAAMAVFSSGGSLSPSTGKKSRGRPLGSGRKKQLEALGSIGIGFTPHIITVNAGEDVSSKIMSFSQNGPRAVCILSANGAISNVTLRQPSISGGTVTYEGRYEILSLTGSFMLSESEGQRSRSGGLNISLSGTDGRVLGGGVAGLLTAASLVQVLIFAPFRYLFIMYGIIPSATLMCFICLSSVAYFLYGDACKSCFHVCENKDAKFNLWFWSSYEYSYMKRKCYTKYRYGE
ncbi:hypothetical protein SAY86_013366 [Trapa natans]|uniref:AT-hook motif nuclear-localized protein n=1 Tax=Trapa natans TaxID=22666 RepID=A0AAN7LZN1_TRANT|nr:hypothetical protein SAY86_013366 [Trapa natans]